MTDNQPEKALAYAKHYNQLVQTHTQLMKARGDYHAQSDGTFHIHGIVFFYQHHPEINPSSMVISCYIAPLTEKNEKRITQLLDENLSRHFKGEPILAIMPNTNTVGMILNVSLEKITDAKTLDAIVQEIAISAHEWEYLLTNN